MRLLLFVCFFLTGLVLINPKPYDTGPTRDIDSHNVLVLKVAEPLLLRPVLVPQNLRCHIVGYPMGARVFDVQLVQAAPPIWAWVKTPLSEFAQERSYLLLPS